MQDRTFVASQLCHSSLQLCFVPMHQNPVQTRTVIASFLQLLPLGVTSVDHLPPSTQKTQIHLCSYAIFSSCNSVEVDCDCMSQHETAQLVHMYSIFFSLPNLTSIDFYRQDSAHRHDYSLWECSICSLQ